MQRMRARSATRPSPTWLAVVRWSLQILIAAGADPTIRGWMGLDALYRAGKRVNDEGRRVYELLEKSARR
jgi:hypothetical protein